MRTLAVNITQEVAVIAPRGRQVQVQNQARERQLADLFNLHRNPDRLGPDAHDELGNQFELKSTTVSGVGTGRDVSIEMLEAWRHRYWIVGVGRNLEEGFVFDNIYFLTPEMMDERLTQIEDHIRPDLELRDMILELLEDDLDREQLERVEYLMSRGSTLNNPKIGLRYIREQGIRIDENHAERLRELVQQHQII